MRILKTPNGALRVWARPVGRAHPLNTFKLAQRAIKGAFVLFSTILLGLVGFVLQNQSFLAHKLEL